MQNINLNDSSILSAAVACYLWGIDDSWLRKNVEKFPEGTIRRFGKQWIVTTYGMNTVFGEMKTETLYKKEELLNDYRMLKDNNIQQNSSLVKIINDNKQILLEKGYDKVVATCLAESAAGKLDFELLLDIFTRE